MIKELLLIFVVFLLFSCNNSEEKSSNITWIGGEIVNPKGEYVYFYKDEQLLDSVPLNDRNFFIYKAKDLTEGLYSFHHKEFQVMYLEPGDSLMLRVNTIDFDESLSYTGIGAERNNFLIEMFLQNEKEIELMPKLYRLPPAEFEQKLDSLKGIRTSSLEEFILSNSTTPEFKVVANANINYDYFSKKELYTAANTNKSIKYDSIFQYPDGFYDYREKIDLGSEQLWSYFPYYRFMYRYFDNLALEGCKDKSYAYKHSYKHNHNKIRLIDSLVINDSLKNSLVKNIAGRYLLTCNDSKMQKKMLDEFLKINTNSSHLNYITELSKFSMNMANGKTIPNLLLVTADNTVKDLHSVIYKPTVIYFWSSHSQNHFKEIHTRVKVLKSKFPKYNFIGINTDEKPNEWLNILSKYNYNKTFEYQFDDISKAEKNLVIYSVNKAIIVNKDRTIKESSTNLFNMNIEDILSGKSQ
jgi:hypothetical protein